MDNAIVDEPSTSDINNNNSPNGGQTIQMKTGPTGTVRIMIEPC